MSKILKSSNPYAYFNGTSSYIQYADNDIFSFTDGVNDLPFEVEFDVYLTTVGVIKVIISKGQSILQPEWLVYASATNTIGFQLNSQITNGIYISVITTSTLTLNTSYKIKVTYDGSKLNSGMKIYVNNVIQATTNSNAGTYLGMLNGTAPMSIGRWSSSGASIFYFKGYLRNVKIKKNNQRIFFTTLQDTTAVSKDVIGGLVHNAGTLPTVVNLSENVLKAENRWAKTIIGSSMIFLSGSFAWITKGTYYIEYDIIINNFSPSDGYPLGNCSIVSTQKGFSFVVVATGQTLRIYFPTGAGFAFTNNGVALQPNTPYRITVQGNGTQYRYRQLNLSTNAYVYDSGWQSATYVESTTVSWEYLYFPYVSYSRDWYLRNLKICDDSEGKNMVLFCPMQDPTNVGIDVVGGLQGTAHNAANPLPVVVNKLERERWLQLSKPLANYCRFGDTSTLGWMNTGIFNMQFDFKWTDVGATGDRPIVTGADATQRGFFFYYISLRPYLYWCNGSGSYGITLFPTALTIGTSYHFTVIGDGSTLQIIVWNNDTNTLHYNSGAASCTYIPNATTSRNLYFNYAGYYSNLAIKNFIIYTDSAGTIPFISIPFQNPENPVEYYYQSGLYTSNVKAFLTNSNENVLKSREMWRYYNGTTDFNAYGSTSTFGWMNSGVFRIEFELIPMSTTVGDTVYLSTYYTPGDRGFKITPWGTNNLRFIWGIDSTSILISNDRVVGKRYKIQIWADGSKVYYRTLNDNVVNKEDLVGTAVTFVPNATTRFLLCLASINRSTSGTYNQNCYMRNLKIYDANNNLFFFVNLQDATQNGDIVGQTLFATGVSTLVDLG